MLKSLYVIDSHSVDPRHNIALEEYLLRHVKPGECIFYLWQNQRTVVIGRNQHASNECRIQALEADGGHLVRRLSGGGAVYHDLGNLNFTFLTVRDDYDVEKQTDTILQAVRSLGIPAEKTGRNDLTADGGKFSGHAYYRAGEQCYHHGTLMVSVDLAPLEKYLNVSPLKLQAKGVKSVRSRVVNLRDFRPDLTLEELRAALVKAFGEVYGLPVQTLTEEELDADELAAGQARFSEPAWIYGDSQPLEVSREAAFPWGSCGWTTARPMGSSPRRRSGLTDWKGISSAWCRRRWRGARKTRRTFALVCRPCRAARRRWWRTFSLC